MSYAPDSARVEHTRDTLEASTLHADEMRRKEQARAGVAIAVGSFEILMGGLGLAGAGALLVGDTSSGAGAQYDSSAGGVGAAAGSDLGTIFLAVFVGLLSTAALSSGSADLACGVYSRAHDAPAVECLTDEERRWLYFRSLGIQKNCEEVARLDEQEACRAR